MFPQGQDASHDIELITQELCVSWGSRSLVMASGGVGEAGGRPVGSSRVQQLTVSSLFPS